MCDTLVALASATSDGSVYFAKNSDREPNEAQSIVKIPAADHDETSMLQCTYISIPQVVHTHAVLLSKPFWIWGAEMGANEHGVVIGNEAVFTKIPQETQPGLIGMDLLRLGLERADSAYQALLVITGLLEQYGQSGNCGYQHPMTYHNSFLICDRQEAWVLETAGRQWAAEKVKDVRAISNCLSIGSTWDLASENLVRYALDQKWCKNRHEFNFAACYSDFLYTTFSASKSRFSCNMNALKLVNGSIDLETMLSFLRNHNRNENPAIGINGADVCMHAGWGPIRISQTAGSLIAHYKEGQPDTYWSTRTAAPCTSVFSPIWLDFFDEADKDEPGAQYAEAYDFWQHEVLHRSVLLDYPNRMASYTEERDNLETEIIREAYAGIQGSAKKREHLSEEMINRIREKRKVWIERVQKQSKTSSGNLLYHTAWRKFNQSCGISALIK